MLFINLKCKRKILKIIKKNCIKNQTKKKNEPKKKEKPITENVEENNKKKIVTQSVE